MDLEKRLIDSQGNPLVEGRVYGIKIGKYTFEGTYQGPEQEGRQGLLILRTGRKSNGKNTILFDHQELPISEARKAYTL